MSQCVLLAYSGEMPYRYLVDVLRDLAHSRGESFATYSPTRVSRAACSEYTCVWLGHEGLCKEPLPQCADVLVGLEELEGRRNARFLSPDGVCVLCSAHRLPMPVAVGTIGYPNDIVYRMVAEGRHVYQIRRVEITNAHVACVMLRALGCDQQHCVHLLAALPDAAEAVTYAFGLQYAK